MPLFYVPLDGMMFYVLLVVVGLQCMLNVNSVGFLCIVMSRELILFPLSFSIVNSSFLC
jgi:hypothetical protein